MIPPVPPVAVRPSTPGPTTRVHVVTTESFVRKTTNCGAVGGVTMSRSNATAVVLARHDARVLACRAVRSAPLLCALTCAALLAGSSVARAADSGEVERLIRQGVELRMKHDDQQALPLFQKAYGMTATPRTAAQLGLVELSLGYLLESERHLTESLAATHDVWVKRNRPAL